MKGGFGRVWGAPLALALVTVSGLASALVSDGWGDVWSWVTLGLPVTVSLRCAMRRCPRQG